VKNNKKDTKMEKSTEISAEKHKIDQLRHEEIARLIRFAPSGHPYFKAELPYYDYMMARFKALGGWNPQLSKHIGW